MFLLIDNYDSFTYNLVQAFEQIGLSPVVLTNDDPAILDYAVDPKLKMVCISPGPSTPDQAGLSLKFLDKLPKTVPVLGVCLGHQLLGQFAGGEIVVGPVPMHGKTSPAFHDGKGLFKGLPSPMTVGRYHSLLVREDTKPDVLDITARTAEGEVMALRYKDRPWVGVQFHPESILTEHGPELLKNFVDIATGKAEPEKAAAEPAKTQTATPISVIIETLATGRDLSQKEAREAFTRLMEGELSPSQAAAFLLGLRIKGETPVEVGEAVQAILAKAIQVPDIQGDYLDIVGTGGDGKRSFNCSTGTSLTLAGLGYKILKHGNRSVSSSSGAADVLEQLGIPLDTPPEALPDVLKDQGFVFLFAPRYHPAFKHVGPVRRELGVRTLFNILGPLVNPARPTHSMLGVANSSQLRLVAESLAHTRPDALGAVILGARGYDELTTFGPADIVFVRRGKTRAATLDPKKYGFEPSREEDLRVESPEESAERLRELLAGGGPVAMRDMLTLNVGLAIYIMDHMKHDDGASGLGYDEALMEQSMEKARTAMREGAGRKFVL